MKAENLESVDSNGLSDPYCCIMLNNTRVAKTKVHKKTLNPVFNESFSIPIESRHRSNVVIEIRDYNMMQKSTIIANLTFPMSRVPANSIIEDDFELEGTPRGTLTMRLTFLMKTKEEEIAESPLFDNVKRRLKNSRSRASSIVSSPTESEEVKMARRGSVNGSETNLSRLPSSILGFGSTSLSIDGKTKGACELLYLITFHTA